MVKNLLSMQKIQERQVQSLGWEDSLEHIYTHTHTHICIGEGNGNPLQYLCLENFHGQRSLAGYSPRGHRVKHN